VEYNSADIVRDVNGDRFSINLGSARRRAQTGGGVGVVVIVILLSLLSLLLFGVVDRSSAEINGRCTCSGVAGPDRTGPRASDRHRKSVAPTTTARPLRFHQAGGRSAPVRGAGYTPTTGGGARVLPVAGRAGRRQHRFGCVGPSWCRRQFPPIVGPPSRPARGARCRSGPAAHDDVSSSRHDIAALLYTRPSLIGTYNIIIIISSSHHRNVSHDFLT